MDVKELQQLIKDKTTDGVLTLQAADLGPGTASGLVTTWLGGTLTISGASARDVTTGVLVTGRTTVLSIADQQVTDVEFAIDAKDGTPSLFLPFPLPQEWSFATSFPETAQSDLAALAYAAPPALLLASVGRNSGHEWPALEPGLTFHGERVRPPDTLGALAALLPLSSGTITLTGPLARGDGKALIRISSPLKDAGALGTSFRLWGGSRAEDGSVLYGMRVGASITIADGVGVAVSAPVKAGTVVLDVDELPTAVRVEDLGTWAGSAAAMEEFTGQGFTLGDTVRLSEFSITIDPAKLPSFAEAVTNVTVKAVARPEVAWEIAGDRLAVTDVGAGLTVDNPLGSRAATATGYGNFSVAQSVRMTAKGEIPPGRLTLTLEPGNTAKLADVVKNFLPTADLSGAPEITLTSFTGTATPTAGEYGVDAEVSGDVALPLGAVQITLTAAEFAVERKEEAAGRAERPADDTHKIEARLSATAKVAPAANPTSSIDFTAVWEIPGKFSLTGKLPDIAITDLLGRLAVDSGLALPAGLPAIILRESQATVQVGQGYELALSTKADFQGTNLGLLGKVAKESGEEQSTVLLAVIWQDAWSWSPREVPGWAEPLEILGDIGFKNSGLAICTADNQRPTGGGLPATLPEELDKGLTFFTEITFGSALDFLTAVFPGAKSIKLTALLAAEVAKSSFTAVIGENDTLTGLGSLTLKVVPAEYSIGLATTFVLEVSSSERLQLTGAGAVSFENGVWRFSLAFVLKAALTELGLAAGALEPEQAALRLDAPGCTVLTAVPRLGWDGRFLHDAAGDQPLSALTKLPEKDDRPAWKNAFGIEGFDVRSFYLEFVYATVFSLGGGGEITVGSADLALAVYGTFDPPAVTAFYFSLTEESAGEGVSLHDIVRVVVANPSAALDVLKQISLKELVLCCATIPGGWTNPATGEKWAQGFYAKGDVDFFSNNWRFELRFNTNGIYARSDIAKPIEFGSVLKLSDTTEQKGPQFLLDLADIKQDVIPDKILALSGKAVFLDLSASLDAHLGSDGFLFDFQIDLAGLKSTLKCVLTGTGLEADAMARLSFQIPAPSWSDYSGTMISVSGSGRLDVSAKSDGVSVTADLSGTATVGDQTLGSLTLGPIGFPIDKWDDVPGYFATHPDVVIRALDDVIWNRAKDCAMKTASQQM
ncbi:hypothetical protein [Kitasatospora griseola]|uniref:hypothetical protein n=1 Tax=Kitasatospora griseola TaxID=2064 RepID=UPI00381C79CA